MNIENAYNENKENFLFSNSKNFSILRNNIINKFDLSPKIKKNNESLKYLDPNSLEFSYRYKNNFSDINFIEHDKNSLSISIIDGKITKVLNNNSNISIKNINNDDLYIEKKFLDFQKFFDNDYVLNINSLMMNSGFYINIKDNQQINIHISNSSNEKDLTVFQKNLIHCSKGSKVNIFEELNYNKNSKNNLVNFIELDEGSDTNHIIFQNNTNYSDLLTTSFTNCKRNSKYKQFILNFSKGSVRNHHYANLLGENSSAYLDGIFFGSNYQYIDNKTQVNHNNPSCISSQRYKGILTDNAKASYLSKTLVNKIAQKTEAYQLSKGILLSESSYYHSKPELRIYADDVKCSHGSTIGPIDKDLLFYLRSRGLNKKESTSLLIKSFFHDIISETKNENIINKFNSYSNLWLSENNL